MKKISPCFGAYLNYKKNILFFYNSVRFINWCACFHIICGNGEFIRCYIDDGV